MECPFLISHYSVCCYRMKKEKDSKIHIQSPLAYILVGKKPKHAMTLEHM